MIQRFLLLVVLATVCFSCSDDNEENNGTTATDSFDRQAMLVNWADNIIIPSYENLDADLENLLNAKNDFTLAISEDNLQVLRDAYKTAYLSFQRVSMFEIGPAETVNYRGFMNTYPTDKTGIDEIAITFEYPNLELPASRNAQGFPALDYLLYGLAENDAAILDAYEIGTYEDYLERVVNRMVLLNKNIISDWKNSYRDNFVSNTSSSSTGSVDRLTNDYIIYYEKFLRSGKVGIPAGAFSGTVQPTKIESFYQPEFSKVLLKEAIMATQDFFNGKYANTQERGKSFKEYLDYLDAMKEGEQISELVTANFNNSLEKTATLENSLLNQINTNNSKMLETFDVLQQNVILLKVDMLQSLSISVDYVDTDGD